MNPDIQFEALPTAPLYELVAFRGAFEDRLPADWPRKSGEARRMADGSAEILKIAADRWLILNARPALVAASAALASAFALTDVTGKWREIRLTGAAATRFLANSVDVAELLADRDCARTVLFDCPVVLYKLNTGFSVWIERSYEYAFRVAAERAIQAQATAP